jgi:hypothetical protein
VLVGIPVAHHNIDVRLFVFFGITRAQIPLPAQPPPPRFSLAFLAFKPYISCLIRVVLAALLGLIQGGHNWPASSIFTIFAKI